MKDIRDWLQSIGMSDYAGRFDDDNIDVSVLRDLTDQDLKELGVTLGHRRKMLRAIAELDAAGPSVPPTPPPARAPRDAAERRQLTVMFCDLVGSTALSARLDPEDVREIIGAYHRCCASQIERHGGFVAKYMGDGVLAYFGYPIAHEHDAERAVQAGLAIAAAAPQLETAAAAPLRVRVGIATGIVVVGDLLGSGEAQERGIVGDTPNLAARLQGIAQPGHVVIAEGTRRLLGDLFELRDLGAQDLKGIGGPTRAWTAVRANTQTSRFEALHAKGLSPLVGREEECGLMLRRWAKARSGTGQVVLLSGEAGIGKSRLTAAFLEQLAGEPHTRLRYFCSPQHTDSAFSPVIGQMERAAGFAPDDGATTKLDKLDALLAASATSPEHATLIADLLSLPNDGRHPALALEPPQRRQKTMEALGAQIEALTRGAAVLMIFEDAHWADPSSLELFGRLVDRIESVRVLLFMTFRPEFAAPWVGRSNVTALTVNRLTQDEVIALIDRVVGNKALAADVRQDIVERADGVPLFVEEMTKAVLEAQSEGPEGALAAIPGAASAVPATLHASLMARLDRLGEAKAVAQIGAAIGREFSHELVAAVFRGTEAELDLALDRLVDAGLVFRQGVAPHATYLFKHALVQDAAYGTLLREPRRALHARIADALPSTHPDIAETRPDVLARHLGEAVLIDQAAPLWRKAGERALARSAIVEAETLLTRAVAQVEAVPGTPDLRRERIKLKAGLANALTQTKGYAAPATKAALEELTSLIADAQALGEPVDDPLVPFVVLYGSSAANTQTGNGPGALECATRFLALARKQRTPALLMIGHRLMGVGLYSTGGDGIPDFNRAIELYDPSDGPWLITRFGFDLGPSNLAWRSLALQERGFPDAAMTDIDQALLQARETAHVPTLLFAITIVLYTVLFRRDCTLGKTLAEELLAVSEEIGAAQWRVAAICLQCCVAVLSGDAAGAIRLFSDNVKPQPSAFRSMALIYMPLAYAAVGAFDEAWRLIGETATIADDTGAIAVGFHMTAGEVALLSPERDVAKARGAFDRALQIARAQNARSTQLRVAMSLARLDRDEGRRRDAYDRLAPLYAWFTEGFDTPDLREAKALLEELGSPATH